MPPEARVAEAIRAWLAQGVLLGAASRRQLEAALPDASAAELAALLADDGHPERDWLLELLFYPDDALQMALEPLLREVGRGLAAAGVLHHLQQTQLGARLWCSAGREALEVPVPAAALAPLVARLHLDRRIDSPLAAACDTLPAALGLASRVRLRNLRGELRGAALPFAARLIAEVLPRSAAELDDLEFLLEVAVAERDAAREMYAALAARKRRLAFARQQVSDLNVRRERVGLEVLLQQGGRLPCIDLELCRRQIALIDRVCLALFGRVEPLPPPERRELRLAPGAGTPFALD